MTTNAGETPDTTQRLEATIEAVAERIAVRYRGQSWLLRSQAERDAHSGFKAVIAAGLLEVTRAARGEQ